MINEEMLREYNEALKSRALTEEEWEAISLYVRENARNQCFNLEQDAPLIAVKYYDNQKSYLIFIRILCKLLNEHPSKKLPKRNMKAINCINELGDGTGCYIAFHINGVTIGLLSALEEYTKFKEDKLCLNNTVDRMLDCF